jgi:hypothetical protein
MIQQQLPMTPIMRHSNLLANSLAPLQFQMAESCPISHAGTQMSTGSHMEIRHNKGKHNSVDEFPFGILDKDEDDLQHGSLDKDDIENP